MQERRTLVYIKEEDIPASAVAWDCTTAQSISGNVLYIPIVNCPSGLAKSPTYAYKTPFTIGIFPENVGTYVSTDIGTSSIGEYVGSRNDGYTTCGRILDGSIVTDYYGDYNLNNNRIYLIPMKLTSNTASSISRVENSYINEYFLGKYLKITFSANVYLNLLAGSSVGKVIDDSTILILSTGYPIYIDTE